MEGRPYPCCYDFKWSEITARGDWSSEPLLFWFQMKWNDSKGRPNIGGLRLNDDPLRRKHRTSPSSKYIIYKMFSSAMGRHWDVCHQYSVFPCCHFTSFEIITARAATVFSLPLMLFHFIWNHNSKGLVSPPLRPIGFVEISPFL